MRTILKKSSLTPSVAKKQNLNKILNKKYSNSINKEKFYSKIQNKPMKTDKDGFLIADPASPIHKSWMEDN